MPPNKANLFLRKAEYDCYKRNADLNGEVANCYFLRVALREVRLFKIDVR